MSKQTVLTIDSTLRDHGTPQNCTFTLKQPLNIIGYSLISAEINHSFYNVTANNNKLDWVSNLGTNITSTIPIKNYTVTELATEIGTQMNADTDDGRSYSASFDGQTGKMTIASNGLNFGIAWTSDVSKNFARLIGFDDAPTDADYGLPSVTALSGATTYTGNNLSWVGQPTNIYLRSNLTDYCETPPNQLLGTGFINIFKKFQVSTIFGNNIVYEPNTPIVFNCMPKKLNQLDFQFIDVDRNEIELNGCKWSLEILFYLA